MIFFGGADPQNKVAYRKWASYVVWKCLNSLTGAATAYMLICLATTAYLGGGPTNNFVYPNYSWVTLG